MGWPGNSSLADRVSRTVRQTIWMASLAVALLGARASTAWAEAPNVSTSNEGARRLFFGLGVGGGGLHDSTADGVGGFDREGPLRAGLEVLLRAVLLPNLVELGHVTEAGCAPASGQPPLSHQLHQRAPWARDWST
jgi:hypothetical protein